MSACSDVRVAIVADRSAIPISGDLKMERKVAQTPAITANIKNASAIVEIVQLDVPGDYFILTALRESGEIVELILTDEAAARTVIILNRAIKDRGWKLRDAPIEAKMKTMQ